MPEPFGTDNLEVMLTAFSDGELSAEQTVKLLAYIAEHPEALEMMDQEQRLRIAARRAVLAGTPPVSSALRDKIAALAADVYIIERKPIRSPASSVLAMAAALALAVGGGAYLILHQRNPATISTIATSNVKLGTFAQDATAVHVDCSRLLGTHTGGIPKELGTLRANLQSDFKRDVPYPDLSAQGYEFVGAGPCAKPLENTVHLLYRSTDSKVTDTLSLFVQEFKSQFDMELGKAYLLTTTNAAHPVYAWRTNNVVYFLIGNDAKIVEKARESINLSKL